MRIIKKPLKSWLYFFFQTQSLLMDKVIKNKRKQVHKNCIISYILSGQVWWCNIKRFWVIPKITSANICKPIHDITNYCTSLCPFESEKFGEEGKKSQKFEYLENEKSFLVEIKNILHSFWRAIILWKNEIW